MIPAIELSEWLEALPYGSSVAIDEGGLTLVCVEDPSYTWEIGGAPAAEDDDCTACNDRSCAWCREEDRLRALPASEVARALALFRSAYKKWNAREEGGEDDLHYAEKVAADTLPTETETD